METLVTATGLRVSFRLGGLSILRTRRMVRALDDVSFLVRRGMTLGIVGESGSGKSTAANALMRLVPLDAGTIRFGETDLSALSGRALRRFRPRLQMIFQDPFSSLNPRSRAGDIVREPLDLQGIGSASTRRDRVSALFSAVGLRSDAQGLFPHQFSGGQRQRIAIARALATEPELIICDEPVSALDVAIQAQVLNLLRRLQTEHGLTYVFISHDLGVVRCMSDDVAVMFQGKIVESAPAQALFGRPLHPYTQALFAARPTILKKRRVQQEKVLAPEASPATPKAGCAFAPRCPNVHSTCREVAPELRAAAAGHNVSCHLLVDAHARG